MQITQDTTLYEIATLDRFAEFSDQVIFARDKSVTIRDLNQLAPDWITSDIAEGFQHLYDTGARCVRPYAARARKGDPNLERVLLFDFTLDEPAPFAVLCAGGGYGGVASMVEAFPSARRLNELGYSALVLQYRAGAYGGREKPLDDLACAVRYILDNAQNLGVRTDAYAVCGYSAGGHLVACFGTEALGWKKYDLPAPGVIWLSYPVITMGPNAHKDSRKNFLRDMAEDPDSCEI